MRTWKISVLFALAGHKENRKTCATRKFEVRTKGVRPRMKHKKTHKKVICLKFLKGECDRNPCWYTHEITPSLPKAGTNQILEGFQGVQPGQIPPKQPNTPRNDQMIIQMMNMMKLQQAQINQMTQALQILATNKSTQQI